MKNLQKIAILAFISIIATSCATISQAEKNTSDAGIIMSKGAKEAHQLYAFFVSQNSGKEAERAKRLAAMYIEESALEGVNSDIAFIQMCLETGFLRFGNLVTPDMNNFCGLGAIDAQNPGLHFETEQIGVRAHIQHLKAYGTSSPLNMPLVDPRYKYVNPKGKSPTVEGLAGTWAADTQYGEKLLELLKKLENF